MSWLVDYNTVFRGFFDLCDDNCSLLAMRFVKLRKLLKGIVADNVGIKNEEGRIIFA